MDAVVAVTALVFFTFLSVVNGIIDGKVLFVLGVRISKLLRVQCVTRANYEHNIRGCEIAHTRKKEK